MAVIDFNAPFGKRWTLRLAERLPFEELFKIDYKEVTVYREDGKAEAGCRIVLGAKARAQVKLLFDTFGLAGVPGTWAELEGNIAYCHWLRCMTADCDDTDDGRLMLDASRTTVTEYYPDRLPAFEAFIAGDIESLRAIHVAGGTFQKNASLMAK